MDEYSKSETQTITAYSNVYIRDEHFKTVTAQCNVRNYHSKPVTQTITVLCSENISDKHSKTVTQTITAQCSETIRKERYKTVT